MKALKNLFIVVSLTLFLASCKISKRDESDQIAEDVKNLKTLPYAAAVNVEDSFDDGVNLYKKDKVFAGYNLFCLRNTAYACLYDLSGKCLKRWQVEDKNSLDWQYVDLDADGNLFFLEKPMDTASHDGRQPLLNALGKLDRESSLLWYVKGRFHHDFIFIPEGRVVTFSRKERLVQWRGEEVPILDDKILILDSATGKTLKEFSVYDLLGNDYITDKQIKRIKRRSDFNKIVAALKAKSQDILIINDTAGDVFHINSIVRIDRKIDGFAEAGDFLISVREPNLVAVLKGDFSGLRWEVRDEFKKQHQPSLLENDNILVFDNKWKDGFSRVVEFDVHSKKVVWQYAADKPNVFFSGTRGGAQNLPNGNVFVANSNQGQLFEITREGELVWRYLSPTWQKGRRKMRIAIYRARRFSKEEVKSLFPEMELGL